MFAALASCSTVSQPVSTTGEKAMTSTCWAMKERMALIWFSCFCCASENFSVMPASVGGLHDGAGVGGAPFALGADLAEAEHDLPVSPHPCFEQAVESPAAQAATQHQAADHRLALHAIDPPLAVVHPVTDTGITARPPPFIPKSGGATASGLTQRRAERRQVDLEHSPGSHPDAVGEAQRGGAEEVQVHVAGDAMRRVLEMVVFEVGEANGTCCLRRSGTASPSSTAPPRRMRLVPSRCAAARRCAARARRRTGAVSSAPDTGSCGAR